MRRRLGILAAILLTVGLVATGCMFFVSSFFLTNNARNTILAACSRSDGWVTDTPPAALIGADDLDKEQQENVGHIIAIGQKRKIPPKGWQVAIQAGMTESKLRNLKHGDRDSLGMFQMRPSMGWGTPEQVVDPVYAVNKFYDVMMKVPDWEAKRPGDVAQLVERSGFPDRYHKWESMARELIAKASQGTPYMASVPTGLSCPEASNTPQANGNPVTSRNARELSDWLIASGAVTSTTSHGCDPGPDLQSGKMVANGLAFMKEMVEAGFKLRLSCTMTGHVKDGLLHPIWHAYDIDMVNGKAVRPGEPETIKMIEWLFARPNGKLPYEVGGPLTPGSRGKRGVRGGPFFTDGGHQGHFHMGFKETTDKPAGGWY